MMPARTSWIRTVVAIALLFPGAVRAAAQDRVAVVAEPDGVMVAVAVVVAGGSALESEDQNGVAFLAGEATLEEIGLRLDQLGGSATVECDAGSLTFTLLLPAGEWRTGTKTFLEQLLQHTPSDGAIERARTRVVRSLALRAGNPAAAARQETREILFRDAQRWARPPCGQLDTVAELEARAVKRHVRMRFSPSRTSVAVVGPVDEHAARELVRRTLDDDAGQVSLPAPPHIEGGRRRVERNTVTAWITLAFPIEEEADPEALRFLAFRLRDAAAPSPARPEVHDVQAELAPHGEHGALTIHLVTDANAADRWRTALLELAGELARGPLDDETFERLLRRYRGERLLELAAPEDRAREAAHELFLGRHAQRAVERIAALDPERVRLAAKALGPPAVVLLGP